MYTLLRYPFLLFTAILLASCATPGPQPAEEVSGSYKYKAWRLIASADNEAINVLLEQADRLIEDSQLDAAGDKLERVLRIKPEYAPAWSRLSWIALQADAPQRSIQMAKRSNSFAYTDPQLQLLNWSFIRDASELLNDPALSERAEQQINLLKSL